MPKKEIDYSKSLIYKFVCNDLSVTDKYVGSTTNFSKRKAGHKDACHNEKHKNHNTLVYQSIRKNGGWENWSMVLVEMYPCKTQIELLARERHFIESLKANLNQIIPTRTPAEYYLDNKEHIDASHKVYREAHKEQQKKYEDEHKEVITAQKKARYENTKQIGRENLTCECGGTFQLFSKLRHEKCKMHKRHLENNKNYKVT